MGKTPPPPPPFIYLTGAVRANGHQYKNNPSYNQASLYLKALILPYNPNRALDCQTVGLLAFLRRFKSRIGGRGFRFQAPLLLIQETNTIYF